MDHTVPPSVSIAGGRLAAQEQIAHFVKHGLGRCALESREPSAHATSGLSPCLHFGQISSLEVALAAKSSASFLEQLIVRHPRPAMECHPAELLARGTIHG
jgi:deoxyribodipyrimidine photo-lyase